MSEAIFLLRIEHDRMEHLLEIVEQQFESGRQLDPKLLGRILEYFADYPDKCHHPVEDLIFRKMERRDSERAASVRDILKDHKSISEATRQCTDIMRQVHDSEGNHKSELKACMQRFVDQHRTHMQTEEKKFFPLALNMLGENDWAEIEHQLFDQSDPLYDSDIEEQFRQLRQAIDELATASTERPAFVQETKALRDLTSVEAFNDLVQTAGYDYRLLEYPEGGYGLEFHGRKLIDIPKCNSTRAAWCAYFYVSASLKRVGSAE